MKNRLRFNRREWAGSFGDLGTDLPLIAAMIPAAGLDVASVLIVFGLAQILNGLYYGLPMPLQPLKAMAVLVIAGGIEGSVLYGAGLAIGIIMLILVGTGLIHWLVRVIPDCVVRGIQLGLGLHLGYLALWRYIPAEDTPGYVLAAMAFLIGILLWRSRILPAALPIVGLGLVYALWNGLEPRMIIDGAGVHLPHVAAPGWSDIITGLIVLALPQLPLSLSNSVIATHKTLDDLFPERKVGIGKIGSTYGVVNIVAPFLSGIPVCHGCGGLAGHHAFGGRTGGSVVLYGSYYLVVGLFFSTAALYLIEQFPLPVLGVLLLFEALALAWLTRHIAENRIKLSIAIVVALCAFFIPQGFLVGLLIGCLLYYALVWSGMIRDCAYRPDEP